jgi:hypothetical protein
MTQKFVRYGPDVEGEEPDFEQTLQTVEQKEYRTDASGFRPLYA